MSFLLFLIAFILVVSFSVIGMVFTIIKSLVYFNSGILKSYFFRLAVSLDQFGGVAIGGLFNAIMISKKSLNKFGDPDETISSVLGKNKREGTLIYWGVVLESLLDYFDPNHSIKSIEE
jgi:hypothetical protein